jgi:hypothetical protein
MTPELQKTLGNAALGAGIGGLGGLGVGLFSKRKKNPLTSALTGAALGGVLGGALPEAWNRGKAMLETPPAAAAGDDAAIAQARAAIYKKMPYWQRAWHHVPFVPPPEISTGSAPPSQPDAYEQEKAKDNFVSLGAGTAAEGAKGGLGAFGGFFLDNPVSTSSHAALAALQARHHFKHDAPAQLARDVTAGLPGLKDVATDKTSAGAGATVTAGPHTTTVPPIDAKPIAELNAAMTTAGRRAKPNWTGYLSHPFGGREQSLDADVGQGLMDVLKRRTPTTIDPDSARAAFVRPGMTNPSAPGGYRVSPMAVQQARNAGRTLRHEVPGRFRRGAWGALRLLGPHALLGGVNLARPYGMLDE